MSQLQKRKVALESVMRRIIYGKVINVNLHINIRLCMFVSELLGGGNMTTGERGWPIVTSRVGSDHLSLINCGLPSPM